MTVIDPLTTQSPGRVPWRGRAIYQMMETSRTDLLGELTELHRKEAAIAARKAEIIDQMRQQAEIAETAVNSRAGGWDARTVARKQLWL